MSRPASTDASTWMVPAASTSPLITAALAAKTLVRRGIAVRVRRIMPVLYSPLIARTARMATTAWPNSIPVRLILAGSTPQAEPASRVPPAQQEEGPAQGERGVAAQHGEPRPRRKREVAVRRRVGGGDLSVLRDGLLDGERGGGGDAEQPLRCARGQGRSDREDERQDDRHDGRGDRPRAAPQHGGHAEGQDGPDSKHCRDADNHPQLR